MRKRDRIIQPEVVSSPRVVERDGVRVDLLGVYSLPYFEHTLLAELIVHLPSREVSLYDFWAPSDLKDERSDSPTYAFWLNREGTELYRFAHTFHHPDLPAPTRFAVLLQYCPVPFTLETPGGKFRVYRAAPIPERLLRLIWVEDLG